MFFNSRHARRILILILISASWIPLQGMLPVSTPARAQILAPAPMPVIVTNKALSDQPLETLLRVFIADLQACQMSPDFQYWSPILMNAFQTQTAGTNCLSAVRDLGAMRDLTSEGTLTLPAGPLAFFCSAHENGSAMWQIGVSKYTQKVEALAFNVTPQPCPAPNVITPDIKDRSCLLFPGLCATSKGANPG